MAKTKEKEIEKEKPEERLGQLQIAEQSLQNLLLQKQVFQLELNETNNAFEELKKSNDGDVFKIVGTLMFKSNKTQLTKDLEKKRDILNLRIKAIEKQEEGIKDKLMKVREEIIKGFKKA
ncbi:MAG: prefoldin subunit beta [Candidatus Pacearchaeota archaeon]|nr:MAG: prefoldin subunit beta [Candidatus Pacearchaeota archaeon]